MKPYLYEYDTGWLYGPASEEDASRFKEMERLGHRFFMYSYHGYALRMTIVCTDNPKENLHEHL